MIRRLAHLCIKTPDLEATERFYVDGLGLSKTFEFFHEGERCGYYLGFGETTFIEVFEGDVSAPGNIEHFAVEVEGMDGVLKRLSEKGYEVGPKKMGEDHTWQAWLTDPNGVRIELHEYTDDSLQLRGGSCEVSW